MWISKAAFQLLKDTIENYRAELLKANERVDRLTEAVARKNEFSIVMPQADKPQFQAAVVPEKSPGWFDTRPVQPPTPPRYQKPNSGGNNK